MNIATEILCTDGNIVMGMDGSIIPVQLRSPRIQPSSVLDMGKKLLHCARDGDTKAVIELMAKGAPFHSDWLGTSPLHLAATNDHVDTCEVLLRAGINKDIKTKVDRTALHIAAYEGHENVCRLLLEYDAMVDCRDMLKMTPLHWAVERDHDRCAHLLLQYGANPTFVSKFNKTPLSIAAENEKPELVEKMQIVALNKQKCQELVEQVEESRHDTISADQFEQIMDERDDEVITNGDEKPLELDSSENDVHATLEQLLPKNSDNSNEATLQLLRDHGITMIPADTSNTVTTALQSGRTIVLSDAGKLMLQETKPKPMQIKKKPVVLPSNRLKSSKVYTLSSSQFMALTSQNKQSFQKVPVSTVKTEMSAGVGMNFIQISKQGQFVFSPPKAKIAKITPLKPTMINNNIGSSFNINKTFKTNNLQQITKPKQQFIQLKNNKLPAGMKIVINKNHIGKLILPKMTLDENTGEILQTSPQMENRLNYEDLVTDDLSYNNMTFDELKQMLKIAKNETEEYRSKLKATEKELQLCREKLKLYESQTIH